LYELLFKGLVRTTARKAQRKANAGRTDGRRAQVLHSRCNEADLAEALGALARWRPEAESGYPLRLIIGIQRDNSTYFSNA
jgi:hypothetical protein